MWRLACQALAAAALLAACDEGNVRRAGEWMRVRDSGGRDHPVADRPGCPGCEGRTLPDRQDCAGCDDGNPCTTDLCNAGSCKHEPAGQVIFRHRNSTTEAHAYTTEGWQAEGFVLEGPSFRTLTGSSGPAVPIYELEGGGDFLVTLDPGEGAQAGYKEWFKLGWGFPGPQPGTIPLFRLYSAGLGLHLSTTNQAEGTGAGYTLEGTTAHVCPL